MSFIPTLKEDGVWLSAAKAKADAFARTFSSKSKLPEEVIDTPFFGHAEQESNDFVTFRARVATRLFKKLDESKATGHDQISAAILKRLADCLGVPFAIVVRRLFYSGCWPQIRKFHLIVPVFRKEPAF